MPTGEFFVGVAYSEDGGFVECVAGDHQSYGHVGGIESAHYGERWLTGDVEDGRKERNLGAFFGDGFARRGCAFGDGVGADRHRWRSDDVDVFGCLGHGDGEGLAGALGADVVDGGHRERGLDAAPNCRGVVVRVFGEQFFVDRGGFG